ncbi:MAG: T9SS type A sorting domain-containing protein [Bacteroidia bacterium]
MKKALLITALFLAIVDFSYGQSAKVAEGIMRSDVIAIGWYPNPVSVGEKIQVDVELAEGRELTTELLDALGRKTFHLSTSYPPGKSRIFIYTNDLKPGLYFVRVSTESGSHTEKVIVK